MRRKTELLLKLSLVCIGHIGVLFIVYGIKTRFFLLADHWIDMAFTIFLMFSPAIPFILNYVFISRSNLLPNNMRRTTAAACSLGATTFSLYWGMFMCLNTFGS